MTTTPDNDPFTLAASPFYCVIFLSERNYLLIYLYECSWRVVYGIISSAGTYMPIERNILERTALFSRNFETTHSSSISQKNWQYLSYCSNHTKFGIKFLNKIKILNSSTSMSHEKKSAILKFHNKDIKILARKFVSTTTQIVHFSTFSGNLSIWTPVRRKKIAALPSIIRIFPHKCV